MTSISKSSAWKALAGHRAAFDPDSFKHELMDDPRRVEAFQVTLPGLHADFSRHLITLETLALLTRLAEASQFERQRAELFEGAALNNTEGRAALHTLLRAAHDDVPAGLKEQAAQVAATFARLKSFTQQARSGAYTDVLSIGIGGSHLGPELAVQALAPLKGQKLRVHFLSNVDPMQAARLLAGLDPKRTLAIVTSKTFTTQETLANARAVRAWLAGALGEAAVSEHFAAVTAAPEKAREFGIAAEQVFDFWDWVGGRYSLWSAVGLPIALAHGFETFQSLLKGAARMDRHFREAPVDRNLPVVLGLLGVWYVNFWQAASRAVIPYRQDLRLLVPYLQQLEMESLGKSTRRGGEIVDYATGPVVWGDTGTNGQHAFFQLLHQGTGLVPVDFIAVLEDGSGNRPQRDMLLANCFAQAEALLRGRSPDEARLAAGSETLAPHKRFPGNRPSTLLLLDRLDAESLGMLIALYEHRTFVQSCIWGINPFDQMGVELGKQLADKVLHALQAGGPAELHDAATRAAVEKARRG